MNKKTLLRLYVLLFFLICLLFPSQVFGAEGLYITVDGRLINADVAPYIDSQNRTIVPIRFIGEELGYSFNWDVTSKEVTVNGNGAMIRLWIGQKAAEVNGMIAEMDTTAVISQGRAMVPLRFILESMGVQVSYDEKNSAVNILRASTDENNQESSFEDKILVINSPKVNVRSGPGTNYSVLFQAVLGDKFIISGINQDWYQVALGDGNSGWLYESTVDLVDAGQLVNEGAQETARETTLVISEDVVNIRTGPGVNYAKLDTTKKGDSFQILSQKDDWYEIALTGNRSGWVAGWLVSLHSDSSVASRTEEPGEHRESPETNEPMWTEPVQISEIKVDTANGGVLLDIAGSQKIIYAISNLDQPKRIVLDLYNCILNTGDQGDGTIVVDHDLVKSMRFAQYDARQVRIVLDLNASAGLNLVSSAEGDSKLAFAVAEPSLAGKTIVIDAGHGGQDPGAIGPSGLYEKDVTLKIALKLAEKLQNKGVNAVLTRSDDTYVSLEGRAAVANNINADLFVSIHMNASTSSTPNGTAVYYYGVNGQGDVRKKLASSVLEELVQRIQRKSNGVLEENFAVLRLTLVPSILVETAFISNNEEEKLLAQDYFQEEAAEGILKGLEGYFLH